MNWSRAKNTLIIALVITNVILLITYFGTERKQEFQIYEETQAAIKYMENSGIKINCDVPEDSRRISVITLKFSAGNSAGGLSISEFEGMPVEIIGLNDISYLEYIEKTDKTIDTLPAYTALLKSLGSVSDEISGIELIYLVDRTVYGGESGEDTALPYWKLDSGKNSYYYSAFAE